MQKEDQEQLNTWEVWNEILAISFYVLIFLEPARTVVQASGRGIIN